MYLTLKENIGYIPNRCSQQSNSLGYSEELSSRSVVSNFFATPWTIALQGPMSMGISRQEYWRGLTFSSPRDLPNPVIKLTSPALQIDSLPLNLERFAFNSLSFPELSCSFYLMSRLLSLTVLLIMDLIEYRYSSILVVACRIGLQILRGLKILLYPTDSGSQQ